MSARYPCNGYGQRCERCGVCKAEVAVSTPPETPHAKAEYRSPSLWARISGAPGREREGRGFAAMGALLLLATGAADWKNLHGVLTLALAWLAFAVILWLRGRR